MLPRTKRPVQSPRQDKGLPIRLTVTIIFWSALLFTALGDAAFYRYQDDSGRQVFVDDIDKVPAAFKDSVKVYGEAADFLSEPERRALEAEEARRQQQHRQRYLQHIRRLEKSAEKKAAAEQNTPPTATPVKVANNQVLVPVKMGFRGLETDVVMLLDTGANVTIIHQEVADTLGMRWPKRATMQVVGGQRLRAGIGTLGHVMLGSLRLEDVEVGIINHQGGDLPYAGLLGMNVLSQVAFKIDLKNQIITWQPRTGDKQQ
jgi:predicted aspartyl protease